MADFPIYRLVKGTTLTFTEMDDNLRWLSRNMSGSIVTITGSVIDMTGSVSITGDIQITGTASIGFIKSEGYSTGSNQLGDDTSDRQTLIGIVSVSGSMNVFGNSKITGSLAQGIESIASGVYSHAEGSASIAIGTGSHAEGLYTIASGSYQHVQGQYNATSSAQSAFIVGNGTDHNNRSNLIFAANNTVEITGSLKVLGSITGSLFGTASNAVSSSYALSASYAVSSSYAYTASSAISAYTASSSVSSSYAYTASSAISAYTASSSVSSSYAYTASSAISAYTASSSVSSSYAYTASSAISASYAYTASSSVSSSYAYTASSAISASYAYTASSAISAYTASSSVSSSYTITASHAESIKSGLNITASNLSVSNNIETQYIYAQSASFGYVQSITGSAVIIGQEYIVLNTQTPSARYAGLLIYDSGSSASTASLVWDSQTNHFVYQSSSGSTYSGGGFLAGPKNSGSLDQVSYPTLNKVLRSQGDDHIYDSNITDDDSKVSISIPLSITGSVTATTGFTGSLFGTASRAISSSYALTASYTTNISGTTNYVSKFTGINTLGNSLVYDDGTNVGINTISPSYRLDVQGSGRYSTNLTVDGYIGINATPQAPYRIRVGGMIRTEGAGNAGRIEVIDTQVGGATLVIDPQRSLGVPGIYTSGAFPLAIATNNTDRITIAAAGTVRLNAYTTNGFVKFAGSDGTLAVDTTTYQPLLNGSGFVSMSGTNVNYVSTIPNSGLTNSSITIQGSTTSLGGSVNVINGTGFVKASGTTITYDNSTYYLASNPSGYTTNTGTVTSVSGTGTVSGISLSGTVSTSGNLTLGGTLSVTPSNFATQTANTVLAGPTTGVAATPTFRSLVSADIPALSYQAPLSGTGFVKISGTTISYDNSTYYLASNPSGYTTNTGTLTSVTVTAGSGMSGGGTLTGAGGTVTLTNAAPDQVVALTQGGTTVITGTYPNFTITSNDQYTGTVTGTGTTNYLPKFTGTSAIGNSLVYDNGTNIGIGTITPTERLHVVGGNIKVNNGYAAYFGDSSNNNGGRIYCENTTNDFYINQANNSPLYLSTNNTIRTTIAGSGNFGIGTTSPGNLLSVAGNISLASAGFLGFTGATALTTSNYALYGSSINTYLNVATGGSIGLNIGNNSILTITGSNVGIGTTSPLAKLHLAGDLRNSFISGVGGINYLNIIDGVSNGFRTTITTGNAITYTFHNGANSAVLNILESGNVGVGTTSPQVPLSVASSGDNWGLFIGPNAGSITGKRLKLGYFGTSDYAAIQSIDDGTSVTSLVLQKDGGFVGIGTTSPAAKLDVSGSILANNFNSDNAVVNTADTYTGTAKITNIITLTQAEYNAIGSPSSAYLYVII